MPERSGPVAIVVPMEEEFLAYRELLSNVRRLARTGPWEAYTARCGTRPLTLIISDCGPANAAAATDRLIARCAPVAVLHGGSAGALNPSLLPGDVVIGDRYQVLTGRAVREARAARGLHPKMMRFRRDGARHHFSHLCADPDFVRLAQRIAPEVLAHFSAWDAPGWPRGMAHRPPCVVTGMIGSTDDWTTDPGELRSLREELGAECEDMESAYVAQVCAMHRVPFLAIRAISDNEVARAFTPAEVPAAVTAAGIRAAHILVAIVAGL
jgi:adenosylhomocysteine nucleosidase